MGHCMKGSENMGREGDLGLHKMCSKWGYCYAVLTARAREKERKEKKERKGKGASA